MKKLTTALLCLLMVFSCAFCVNAEDATEVPEETPVEVQEAKTKVAKIGDVEYATLQEAIDAAKNGEEVVLLQDVKEHVRVSETSNVVLNLNGHSIDTNEYNNSTIDNYGTIKIVGEGTLNNSVNPNAIIWNWDGTTTIDGGNFYKTSTMYNTEIKQVHLIVCDKGSVTINSGKFSAEDGLEPSISSNENGFVTINGGTFGNGDFHFGGGVIKGGTFYWSNNTLLRYYLEEGYIPKENEDGSHTVVYNKVNLSAYQDENGDLIIKGPENLIGILFNNNPNDPQMSSRAYLNMDMVGTGWHADFIENGKSCPIGSSCVDDDFEKVDNTTLVVRKSTLIKKGIANGKYKFTISFSGDGNYNNQLFEGDLVEINTGIEYKPNQQKTITVVGQIPEAVVGKPTRVADSSLLTILGEDGKPLDSNDYNLVWCDEDELDASSKFHVTKDKLFKKDKVYHLGIEYKYIFDKENDIWADDIKISSSNEDSKWENIKLGGSDTVNGTWFDGFYIYSFARFISGVDVVPVVKEPTAKIGNKEYTSIQEAIDSAEKGDEIMLVNDSIEDIYVQKEKEIVLNIGNHTVHNVYNRTIVNEGKLTIKGTGTIYNSESIYGQLLYNSGSLIINGPSLVANGNDIGDCSIIYNSGNLVIEGKSHLKGETLGNGGTLTINDGEFQTTIFNYENLNINDGMFNNSNGAWIVSYEGTTVINGGKFINSSEGLKAVDGTFEIKGGKFSSALDNLSHYLANGYCLSKNANGETTVVKATQAAVKEPTVVGNQENLDIVKKTEEFKNVQSVAVNANVKKQLTPNEVKKIEAIVENNKADVSYKIPLDLKLAAIKDDGTETNITKLDQEITVSLALSDENVKALKGAKEIKVARFHGDEVTLLDAKLEGNILTFKTDRFSTYVVVAYKEAGSPSTPTPETKPNTTPTGSVTCEESMGSANWIWSESKKACVYKVSNTSVK